MLGKNQHKKYYSHQYVIQIFDVQVHKKTLHLQNSISQKYTTLQTSDYFWYNLNQYPARVRYGCLGILHWCHLQEFLAFYESHQRW